MARFSVRAPACSTCHREKRTACWIWGSPSTSTSARSQKSSRYWRWAASQPVEPGVAGHEQRPRHLILQGRQRTDPRPAVGDVFDETHLGPGRAGGDHAGPGPGRRLTLRRELAVLGGFEDLVVHHRPPLAARSSWCGGPAACGRHRSSRGRLGHERDDRGPAHPAGRPARRAAPRWRPAPTGSPAERPGRPPPPRSRWRRWPAGSTTPAGWSAPAPSGARARPTRPCG